MSQLYGEKWDPALDPEGQMKGASSGGKFVKLARFGLFVKAVFIVSISSAIVESLFSRCATCPSHSSRLIIEVLMRSGRYGYIRGKTRASMADDTAANVQLTSELADVIGDVRLCFSRVCTLRVQAVDHELTWG
jgi:hypothetical protein